MGYLCVLWRLLSSIDIRLASSQENSSIPHLDLQATFPMTEADIPKGKYPAKTHARRVVDYIRSKIPHADGFIFLSGSPEKFHDDTDLAIPFRQRSAFMYLTGVDVPDCHLLYEIANER